MSLAGYTEDGLTEQPTIALLLELGCETVTAITKSTMAPAHWAEVILTARLHPALRRLNPEALPEIFRQPIEEPTCYRSRLSAALD